GYVRGLIPAQRPIGLLEFPGDCMLERNVVNALGLLLACSLDGYEALVAVHVHQEEDDADSVVPPIPELTSAEVHEPPEIGRMEEGMVGPICGRTQPHIPVEVRGNRVV